MPRSTSAILSALPIFAAAARHGNFSQAARELGLTQSAVSRRVQALERHLGAVLFTRKGRMLAITADGQRIAQTAQAAIRLVEDAHIGLGNPVRGALRIGVLPSIGSLWLTPRINDFLAQHPDITVSISTIEADFSMAHKDPVTWDPSVLDVVLTWGRGGWKSLTATRLSGERMVPVCAPEFATAHRILTVQDIWNAPLLVHQTRPDAWQGYRAAQAKSPATRAGGPATASLGEVHAPLAFEHFYMIIEAAKAGAGIALLPSLLVADALTAGRLISCGPAWETGYHYAALSNQASRSRPAVKAFLEWVGGA